MGKFIDLTGKSFGYWKVLQRVNFNVNHTHWLCRCKCGIEKLINGSHLRSGLSTKCKTCHNKEAVKKRPLKHGNCKEKSSKEYKIWSVMKTRCLNPNSDNYHLYGGRGIKICDEWLNDFSKFLLDMGKCPVNLTLDRIDVNGNYSKDNCRWATVKQQCENKRTNRKYEFERKIKTLTEWSKIMKIPYTTLSRYIKKVGWEKVCEIYMPLPEPPNE